jgi:hypothetical protein
MCVGPRIDKGILQNNKSPRTKRRSNIRFGKRMVVQDGMEKGAGY